MNDNKNQNNLKRRKAPPKGHGKFKRGDKAKDFKGSISKLFQYLGKHKLSLVSVIVFAVGSTVFNIFGPKILGNATTEIYTGIVGKISGGGGIDFAAVGRILLLCVTLYVLSAVLSWLQGFIMAGVTQKVTYRMRREISEKIHRLPMNYFDKVPYGEVLSRVTNDVDTLSQGLNQSATQVITSVTMLIGILVMMLSISPMMTLIAVVSVPLSLLIVGLIVGKSQKHFTNQQNYLGEVDGQIEEIFAGQNIVKAFNAEQKVTEEFNSANDKLYESAWKSQGLSGMMHPLMAFVGNLGYVAVAIFGGYLVIKGRINVGDIQSFIQYVRQFTQPLSQIAQISNMMQSTAASAERVFEFLAEKEEELTARNPMNIEDVEGSVQFAHVHFGYKKDKEVIHDFCANIEKGKKIAIVGPTGAGKTTIVKLLMRFYDVNEGSICVDSMDIRDFNRSELRSVFAMVLQDTWLFNGTIRENIRYGALNASDEDVERAAKMAHADHFIKTLPDGYDTVMDEDADNISQGQKQLLTIARAFLADPKILILDEATSSVDTRTEMQIQKAMDSLTQGRTSFIIAHRLSTIRDADTIFVMNNGDIVEQGTHDELLAKNGFYAELYNSQFDVIDDAV